MCGWYGDKERNKSSFKPLYTSTSMLGGQAQADMTYVDIRTHLWRSNEKLVEGDYGTMAL